MKKNIFPFISDVNLTADIDCLLKFVREPLHLDKPFKKIPNDILNAKLKQLKFDNPDHKEPFFNINLETRWKNKQFKLTDKFVNSISITDKSQLIEELQHDKLFNPESTLKQTLKKIIVSHTNEIVKLNIDNTINLIQKNNLNFPQRENQVLPIKLFFIFLKIFMQGYSLSRDQHSSEALIKSATCLTRSFSSDMNNFIICLNDELSFAKESTEKSKKVQQKANISKMVFIFDQLITKLTSLASNPEQKDIRQLLDSIFKNFIGENLLSKYDFFKQAYFSEKGFACIFGDYSGYDSILMCRKKLDYCRKNILIFHQLIDELATHANKIPEILDFSNSLKEITAIYFQSLLHNSLSNKENLNSAAFEKFESSIKNKISNFQKNHLCTEKIYGALNKLLNALAKFAPKFLISKEKRISFFKEKLPEVESLNKIANNMPSMKI